MTTHGGIAARPHPRGLFVTFEGGEGSGKTTQLARLAERLRARGIDPLVTREPGGTPLAEGIRRLLLDEPASPGPVSEAMLMEAARADLVERVIRPALAEDRVVLCDRYDDSTLAYQGGGRSLDRELLVILNRAATSGLKPHLTLLYDIEPAVGLGRRNAGGLTNRLDREPPEFYARVRTCYLELAAAEPRRFVVLDAAMTPAELERIGWSAIEERLPPRP